MRIAMNRIEHTMVEHASTADPEAQPLSLLAEPSSHCEGTAADGSTEMPDEAACPSSDDQTLLEEQGKQPHGKHHDVSQTLQVTYHCY
jgi:hypothetical protein